jgi:hypothetical protein
MAGNSSWDQANRRQKLGLVWRIRKKISQIIKDYFHLLFFLLIILWYTTIRRTSRKEGMAWYSSSILSGYEYLARSFFCLHPPQRVAVGLDDQSQAEDDFS